jgi:hypothetical protein
MLKNKIEKKAQKNKNTGIFDKLLLEGGNVKDIFSEVKKKGYKRVGWFISDRTFWGHIGVRIRDENFVISIQNGDILSLSATKEELKKLFEKNVYIKLIGCGNDIEDEPKNKS